MQVVYVTRLATRLKERYSYSKERWNGYKTIWMKFPTYKLKR